MDARSHFETLARYNRWANRQLCDVAAQVSDAQYREDRGAFFGSLRGTLNHILAVDRLWLERIEGSGPKPSSLDGILHDGFAGLRAAREAEDERLLRVASQTPAERFGSTLAYRSTEGEHYELPFAQVLTHVFNHQTHHRGQAHTLLGQFGLKTPVLDFVYFLLESR
ncbi:DinB family protein [Azospirillum picis]|uniref:Damage-inducible protein DinB n=1 Tax=Azospirillum picis TaxID=488438 RepID=A0ABU0MJT9_9PROT|nr:DinB family protein [Azospirillum picis]MBP2300036.1 putative damage-inducible protein DinB [Azospirillum picis]MDQ0533726.1 putative damage-inducible protein DinB [Azospirillum picis]